MNLNPIILNSPMRVGSTYLARLLADYYGLVIDWDNPVNLDNLDSRLSGCELLKMHELDRERVKRLGRERARVITMTRNPLFATISRIRHAVTRYRKGLEMQPVEIQFLGLSKRLWSKSDTFTLEQIIDATTRFPEVPQWYFRDVVSFGKDTDLTFNELMVNPEYHLSRLIGEDVDLEKLEKVVKLHNRYHAPDPDILDNPLYADLLSLIL